MLAEAVFNMTITIIKEYSDSVMIFVQKHCHVSEKVDYEARQWMRMKHFC